MNAKQRAATAGIEEIKSGMIVGLGTGSTAEFFLTALGQAIAAGTLREIRAVPTSQRSEDRARELGIPIVELRDGIKIDLTIDGADEVAPNRDLIKGLGGALLREKIVAQNSARVVIIVDSDKLVPKLGTRCPLPVEVATFGYRAHEEFLRALDCEPTLRVAPDGLPFVTDNGNHIYDCKFAGIEHAAGLAMALRSRAGIVESGLFLGLASAVIVGYEDRVERM